MRGAFIRRPIASIPANIATAAASNPAWSPHLLEVFVKHDDSNVRRSVTEHPNCPDVLLRWRAADDDMSVSLAAIETFVAR